MAERDQIHFAVRAALEKGGWVITDDPLRIPTGGTVIKMDIGAERLFTAEKEGKKIAVEVKSLIQPSIVYSFYEAFGQYMLYRDALQDEGIDRQMFLAISDIAFLRIEKLPFLYKRLEQYQIRLIIVNIEDEKIEKWIR